MGGESGVIVALATFPDKKVATQFPARSSRNISPLALTFCPQSDPFIVEKGKIVEETEALAIFKTISIYRGQFQ